MTTIRPEVPACHLCGAEGIKIIPSYETLCRVTSDCKSWPAGGHLGVCRRCGNAQAVLDEKWQRDIAQIYHDYTIYHQSHGAEQSIFEAASGQPMSRSACLVQQMKAASLLPTQGRMMDFGCGNGKLLKSFGAIFQDWTMAGLDLSYDHQDEIESIKGVERLFVPPMADVPGTFDLITGVHVLEHIESPIVCLTDIRGKLNDKGVVLIQVPDCEVNPFALLIADHATHFCLPGLQRLVENAGFEILIATNQWVAKELTIVARRRSEATPPVWTERGCLSAATLNAWVAWLVNLSREAQALSERKPFGVFGTSIAGTFLAGELGNSVDFYVDEDPGRQSQIFAGRPIFPPNEVPLGSHIFVGLAPGTAGRIIERMKGAGLPATFYAPPPLPAI